MEDAKTPKGFIVPRFHDFYEVAPEYITSNPLDDDIITNAINTIQGRNPGSDWDEQNRVLNCDLLGNLVDIPDLLPLDGLTLTALPNSQTDLSISGVTVSVRPEILLRGVYRGSEVIGALKLYLPKTYPLTAETADYITTTIHQFLMTHTPAPVPVDYRLCFVADVSSRTVFAAPRSYARRRTEIQAACEEIAVRWPTIA